MWTAVVLTALVLQSTLFAQMKLGGAKPDLVYLATIVLAVLEGPFSGALAGFFGGIMEDFLLNQPKGVTALTLTLVGYAVGTLRQFISSPSPVLPVILVGGVSFAAVIFYGLVDYLIGHPVGGAYLVRVALLTGLYNALLTPILYPVIRRVAEASRGKKAFRW